jgi:hypothetical protein
VKNHHEIMRPADNGNIEAVSENMLKLQWSVKTKLLFSSTSLYPVLPAFVNISLTEVAIGPN